MGNGAKSFIVTGQRCAAICATKDPGAELWFWLRAG